MVLNLVCIKVMLLLTLMVTGNSVTCAQEVATKASTDAAAAATAAANPSAALSPSSPIGRSTTRTRVTRVPRSAKMIERHPMLTSLSGLQAVTQQELQEKAAVEPAGAALSSDAGSFASQANGASGASYSDSRFGKGTEFAAVATRRVGRLTMRFGGQWSLCTASVINKALLVTAAHCVFNYGNGSAGWPDIQNNVLQVAFEPGLDNTKAPLGRWQAKAIMVPGPYFSGTDVNGGSAGVPVNNDIALVWLNPLNNKQIGDVTGWFAYGWNGYSFSAPVPGYSIPTAPVMAQLTQFGYPAVFDGGVRMQISNAATFVMQSSNADFKNIIRGTAMTAGSSGGPWIANYGLDAVLNDPAFGNYGSNGVRNAIMGVTSWGYIDAKVKAQGASYFGTNKAFPNAAYGSRGAGNIGKLMYDACDSIETGAWRLKSQGLCS